MRLGIPVDGFVRAMDFSKPEVTQLPQLINHVFFGLGRDNLIDRSWTCDPEVALCDSAGPPGSGIICDPCALGAELYLWAFGHGDKPLEFMFDPSFSPAIGGLPEQFPDVSAANPEWATTKGGPGPSV
jgi:hypothetical protein